jgi:hypothetical protein
VTVWLRWLAACAAPFLITVIVARFLGLVGVIPALDGPFDAHALPVKTAPIVILALIFGAAMLMRGPLARAFGARPLPRTEEVPGAAAAIALSVTVLAILIWAVNPFTALLLTPAVHLWLLAVVPEWRLPRPLLVLQVLLGLVPFALVGVYYMSAFGLGFGEAVWESAVLLAGGTVGPLGALVWSALLGVGTGAILVALRKRPADAADPGDAPVSIRGPLSYAGPGSLGGTDSALRR